MNENPNISTSTIQQEQKNKSYDKSREYQIRLELSETNLGKIRNDADNSTYEKIGTGTFQIHLH